MNDQMITRAREYAESRRGDWGQLAEEADVSYDWLCKFMQGRIPDPSYFRIARIYMLAAEQDAQRKKQKLKRN